MCGAPHAVANAVYAWCRISHPSCVKAAREHSRHKDVALDRSLRRVAKHGTLILFLPRYFPSHFPIGLARRTLRAGSTPPVPRSYQYLWS